MVAIETSDIEVLMADFGRTRDALTAKIEELRDTAIGVSRVWFDKNHLCALREVNDQYFNSRPHLLPNFGVPDDRYPKYRWHRTTVAEWIDTPLWELGQRWAVMTQDERNAAIDARKNPERADD